MASQTTVEVEINNKKYQFSGVESEEYMQHAASYINDMISKMQKKEGYDRLNDDLRAMSVIVQITDDFFNEKKRADELEHLLMERDSQLTELKHELIALQMEAGKTSLDQDKKKEQYHEIEYENTKLKERIEQLDKELKEAEKKLSYRKRK